MDFMELSRDTTRFLNEFQYLHKDTPVWIHCLTWFYRTQTDISIYSLGDFEDPEQPQCSQDTDSKRSPRLHGCPDHLKNTANDHLWTQFDKSKPSEFFFQ